MTTGRGISHLNKNKAWIKRGVYLSIFLSYFKMLPFTILGGILLKSLMPAHVQFSVNMKDHTYPCVNSVYRQISYNEKWYN